MKKPRLFLALVPLLSIFLTTPVHADPLAAPLGTPPVEAAPAASSDREGPSAFAGDTLAVDLTSKALEPAYLSPGTVSARTPLSQQVARAGAVAGVNGDFFDINAGRPFRRRCAEHVQSLRLRRIRHLART